MWRYDTLLLGDRCVMWRYDTLLLGDEHGVGLWASDHGWHLLGHSVLGSGLSGQRPEGVPGELRPASAWT